jgi:soluble lytic murein transglycosylase
MNYNLKIGQAYLSGLLKHFNGSYVLSLAAYNAGASRIKRWIVHNGDPRDNSVDPIDWIEKIPFTETRNYVQRVLENLTVYRIILNKPVTHFNKKNSLPYWKLKVDRAITHN